MATESWSSRIRHSDDATWQEWRDELITKLNLLVAAGVLAADETNITPGAGSRPGALTEGGYAVYHLNDSLHGTAPIYLRFSLGTGNGSNLVMLRVTVGTSTNGSGVIGGIASSMRFISGSNGSGEGSDTPRQSYMSCSAGFFGLDYKIAAAGSTLSGVSAFFIARTVDNDGAITAVGALASWRSGASASDGPSRQAFRYQATAVAYTAQTAVANQMLGFIAQAPASSLVGSDLQVALAWTMTPRAAPLVGVCGVYPSELTPGGTFTTTLVGSTPRTYLTCSQNATSFGPIGNTATGGMCVAMLWE